MDLKTLQEYRKEIIAIFILGFVGLVTVVYLIINSFSNQGVSQAKPLDSLSYKDNKIDPNSDTAKNGKKVIDKLSSNLPYRQSITVSTGTKVTYSVFRNKTDAPYFVRVEIFPDLFLTTEKTLPKQILEFRETAKNIYAWVKSKGVNESDLLIRWGSHSYEQQRAEGWVTVSSTFPEVVKKGNTYVFK